MRLKTLSFFIILALGLAACAGAESPTQAPDAADPVVQAEATQDPTAPAFVIVTPEPTVQTEGALEIPGVGTLIASETEDPNMGVPFDTIYVLRTSGEEAAIDLELELRSDGSYTRNGVAGLISPEEVGRINALLDELNFFGLQASMLGPSAENVANRYTVTVFRAGQSRSVNSEDEFMPNEYIEFLVALLEIGFRDPGA